MIVGVDMGLGGHLVLVKYAAKIPIIVERVPELVFPSNEIDDHRNCHHRTLIQ